MIDTLTVHETKLVYLLNSVMEQPRDLIFALPDPTNKEYKLSVIVEQLGKVQLDMNLSGDNPSIHAVVPLHLDVLTNHGMTSLADNQEARDQLKESFEQAFNDDFTKLIIKTQEEFGTEPFSWSLAARREFWSIPEFTAFDWKETYPEIDITIETQVTFKSFGRQTELPDLDEMRD